MRDIPRPRARVVRNGASAGMARVMSARRWVPTGCVAASSIGRRAEVAGMRRQWDQLGHVRAREPSQVTPAFPLHARDAP